MVERGGCFRFLHEAVEAFRILREPGGQQLERDLPAQPCVLSQVNLTHAACTEERENVVVRQGRIDC
jgi:hypothetical protein